MKSGATKEVFASLAEKAAGLVLVCPKCGSKEMVQILVALIFQKRKRAAIQAAVAVDETQNSVKVQLLNRKKTD